MKAIEELDEYLRILAGLYADDLIILKYYILVAKIYHGIAALV
jgi:hypothetical protein